MNNIKDITQRIFKIHSELIRHHIALNDLYRLRRQKEDPESADIQALDSARIKLDVALRALEWTLDELLTL